MFICLQCHYAGDRKTKVKGSFIVELSFWIIGFLTVLIFPFIIIIAIGYSAWRLMTKEKVCPECNVPNTIPENTPKAQKILIDKAKNKSEEQGL